MFTVKFTTRREITRYNDKGVAIEVLREDVEVVLHGLPGSTAAAYSHCDNFSMAKEFYDPNQQRRSSFRAPVREVSHEPRRERSPVRSVTSVEEAARTGDMSAAINNA